jgi:UDP-GlcNAc:undecaprenyl-phosphate GlcNAc-1-phosphate transferase
VQNNWLLYIAAFASAFAIALLCTPFAKKLSVRFGAVDYPKKRGMHKEPIPRMGGIAIVISFLVTAAVITPFVEGFYPGQLLGFLAGAVIIAITGALDDIYGLRPRAKLVMQIIVSLIVIYSGTRINFVMWPVLTQFEALSAPITMLWIIGIINAVNLIDGLDGLAAGVSSISALCIAVLCFISGNTPAAALAAILAGSCFGFLPRNFNPAEVFMGDTGALFLGYVLAVSSVMGLFKSYALLAVGIAGFALALPIFDTAFAMVRRAAKGKPIMRADRGHLHHRLIDAGFSHARTVVILYIISFICGIIAIAIALQDLRAVFVMTVFVIIMALMLYVYKKRK